MAQEQTHTFRVRRGLEITDALVQKLTAREVGNVKVVRWSVDYNPVRYDAYEGWMVFNKEHNEVHVIYTERGL